MGAPGRGHGVCKDEETQKQVHLRGSEEIRLWEK